MIFADKLIALRKKAGWSQEELAQQKLSFYCRNAFYEMQFPIMVETEADRLFLNIIPFFHLIERLIESLQDDAFSGA